jgi:hypothetical protein
MNGSIELKYHGNSGEWNSENGASLARQAGDFLKMGMCSSQTLCLQCFALNIGFTPKSSASVGRLAVENSYCLLVHALVSSTTWQWQIWAAIIRFQTTGRVIYFHSAVARAIRNAARLFRTRALTAVHPRMSWVAGMPAGPPR